MMNCWSSIQPARFFFRVCCFLKKASWQSGNHFLMIWDPPGVFSENNKRGQKLGLSGKMAFFFVIFGEGILENCPLQKKGIFQVKR